MGNISWLVVLMCGCCLLDEGASQALNRHINPLWVESGRELLARQQALGLGSSNGGLSPSYNGAAQTSLFYLDGTGQFRPVFLGNSQQIYSNPRLLNGNAALGETNFYPGIQQQRSPYIK